MTPSPRHALALMAVFAGALAVWGCKDQAPNAAPSQVAPPAPPAGSRPDIAKGPGGARPIMMRIGKGPDALDGALKRALGAAAPDWSAIEPQAAEYARLAAGLAKVDPVKGSKESWTQQTAAFSESAAALDKAAQTHDLAAARTAQEKLSASCMECHRQHRGGKGGKGFGPKGNRGGPPG